MQAYLTGIGWVGGAGPGWGSQGGDCVLSGAPIAPLARKDVFPEPNQRFGRLSEYAKLGLAAIAFALRDAGIEEWSEKRPVGVVASTLLGCLATDLQYHQTVLLEGGGLASPNLFAYTLANCFLGDAAIQFGLTGSLVAINEAGDERLAALRYALEELFLGEAGTMLAGLCDLPAPELVAGEVGQAAGAVFLVLSTTPPGEQAVGSVGSVRSVGSAGCYGTLTLAADGAISLNGAPVTDLYQLLQKVLPGRCRRPLTEPAAPATDESPGEPTP